jgi:hypothetical protein
MSLGITIAKKDGKNRRYSDGKKSLLRSVPTMMPPFMLYSPA